MGTAEYYKRGPSGISKTNFDLSVYSLTLPITAFEHDFVTIKLLEFTLDGCVESLM